MRISSQKFAGRMVRIRVFNRKKIALAVSVSVLTLAALVFLTSRLISPNGRAAAQSDSVEPGFVADTPESPLDPVWETKVIIPPGTSLAALLGNRDFTSREIHRLKEAVKPVYDLAKIKAGRELRIGRGIDGGWESLEYDIDDTRFLAVTNGEEAIRAEIRAYPFEVRPVFVSGMIEDSLIGAINRAGERDPLALDLVERCFGWDIDFFTDLRGGDSFKIVVEKKYINGEFSGYRNILAAEFVNKGTTHRAFRFTYPDTGNSDYFDGNGGSKRKEFLRSPFKFTPRITSRFTSSRLHPVYKVNRAHYGVDYAAPIGTGVQATADGEVTFAGRNGGSGNMVRLKHKNGYETMYLHLSRFGRGVRKGAKINGGDVIGYVGTSGDSTGPHLDYRIRHHGSYVNPLSVKFKPAEPLRREFLEAYEKEVQKHIIALETPTISAVSRAIGWGLIS